MTRRFLLSLPVGVCLRGANAKKASYKATAADTGSITMEFLVTAEDAFPIGARDPVLFVGGVSVRDYRWAGSDGKSILFVCHEADKLKNGAEMYVQYEDDARTRFDLPRFHRAAASKK